MKKLYLLVWVLLISLSAYAQKDTLGILSVSTFTPKYYVVDKSQDKDGKSTSVQLTQRHQYINNLEDNFGVEKNNLGNTNTLTINKVEIQIVNGTIDVIDVYTSKGIYTNTLSQISLSQYNFAKYGVDRRHDHLYNVQENGEKTYLIIGDFLQYSCTQRKIAANSKFVLDEENDSTVITSDIFFDLDVKAYSDILALTNTKANGIAQFEMSVPFILNTTNQRGTKTIWFHYIKPFANYARLDSADKRIAFNNVEDSTLLRTTALQRSSLAAGADLNIFHNMSKGGWFEFGADIGYQYNNVDLFNTADSSDNSISSHSAKFRFNLGIANRVLCINPTLYLQKYENKETILFTQLDNKFNALLSIPVTINITSIYNPDKKSGLYIRFNQFFNLAKSGNDFQQLQIGYKSSLTELFKK